jgi:hypothetical protein
MVKTHGFPVDFPNKTNPMRDERPSHPLTAVGTVVAVAPMFQDRWRERLLQLLQLSSGGRGARASTKDLKVPWGQEWRHERAML